jgi:hypothetical protein
MSRRKPGEAGDTSEVSQTADTAPLEAAQPASSGEPEAVAAIAEIDRLILPQYRNISRTILPLDNGETVPPLYVIGLTQAEIERFENLGREQGYPYIQSIDALRPPNTQAGG